MTRVQEWKRDPLAAFGQIRQVINRVLFYSYVTSIFISAKYISLSFSLSLLAPSLSHTFHLSTLPLISLNERDDVRSKLQLLRLYFSTNVINQFAQQQMFQLSEKIKIDKKNKSFLQLSCTVNWNLFLWCQQRMNFRHIELEINKITTA